MRQVISRTLLQAGYFCDLAIFFNVFGPQLIHLLKGGGRAGALRSPQEFETL